MTKPDKAFSTSVYYTTVTILAALWWVAYSWIIPFSQWVTFSVAQLTPGSHAAAALEFFVYDTLKILMLLVLMVYVLAWARASLNVEKVREFLMARHRMAGYFLGALFGAVTPFCSCSSIPLFMGFTTARIPLGVTIAFLVTSPLINEIAVVILWGLLGWKFTLVYVTVGMAAGIAGGYIIDLCKAERWLQPFLLDALQNPSSGNSATPLPSQRKPTVAERHYFAQRETRDIFRRVWLWVVIGVGVGAALHGYVPQNWIAEHLGQGQWWSVPIAVTLGIPLYTNVTGIIPIMESLLLKGLPMGTTLALCMSTVAVSLPELLMLKQVMRWQLLTIFVGMMLVIFTLVGWLFNSAGVALIL